MTKRILAVAFALAFTVSATQPYPQCTGDDCTVACTNQPACQAPPVPCPQAGPPWC